LEIAIGNGEYDRWAKFEGAELIVEKSTVEFLKTKIVQSYHNWYRRKHNNEPPTSTFVVLTSAIYDKLSPLDRDMCHKIEFEFQKDNAKKFMFFFTSEVDRVQQKGKILEFLEKVDKPSAWYSKIDRIFVPSNEYLDIIESVEKNNAVILVGDPEIGKTFTATRIMWKYYCRGYTPVWYSGSEIHQRMEMRQKMTDAEIRENSVVYFEDPFGKVRLEDREELRRTIGNLFRKAHDVHAKVIITSREEPFREFEKEKLSQTNLQAFSVEMNLMKPSYSKEKMEKILLNWATEFGCQWLQKKELKSFVIKETSEKLNTPLSLKDFAFASKDCSDVKMISSFIKEKSKETKEAFAEEIAKMNREKVLFLSVIYILPVLKMNEIETIYYKTCKKFRLDPEINSFEYLQKWFETKITSDPQKTGFEFTHPSYEEGLIQSWNRIELKNLVLKILNELIKDDNSVVRGSCGFRLIENFEEISFKDEAKLLVDKIVHDKKAVARYGVASAIGYYFSRLPKSLALRCLDTIAEDRNREIRAIAPKIIGEHFNKIPKQKSLKLISKSLEDRAAWVRLSAVSSVMGNMEELPEEVVMTALTRCRELCNFSGGFISYFASLTYRHFEKEVEKLKKVDT